MTTVQEIDLELSFPNAKKVVHFDDSDYHGNSTIKRVDFVAEYEAHYLFIEVKDPDIPTAQNGSVAQIPLGIHVVNPA